MLTADLVHVRRRGDQLQVVPLSDTERPRARELASTAIELVRAHVGLPRGALLEAWSQVALTPSEARLGRGLFKLTTDACDFDEGATLDPVELRRELFTQAAQFRRSGAGDFDRDHQVHAVAQQRGVDADTIEEALYADLPTAHLLRKADLPSADGLLVQYDLAQHQAVLLRAVRLQARVFCATASTYRTLFRKLKFHRLLYSIAKLDRGKGYAIHIDGPFSLFEQTTKYGVQFALVLPAIMECDVWDLSAELRWGKDRRPLRYHVRGSCTGNSTEQAPYSNEVMALLSELRAAAADWEVALAEDILDLPGVGLCVPDLVFIHRKTAKKVFLEVLGFWSRDAVWKRIALAQAGLPHPIVFAVSRHLRVSEEALGDETPAALYVYARSMNAKAVLERVAAVAER